MPRVLITGAAGFIGMHTSIRFLNEGWNVVGLDNLNNYYSVTLKRDRLAEISSEAKRLGGSFEMFEADLNSEVWKKLESYSFEAIVHLAAQAGVRYSLNHPRAYLDSNILGFQSVLEFVLKKNISKFLYASSSSVYGDTSKHPFSEKEACDSPKSYYAATKIANELMAKAYFKTHKLKSVGLRFFTVYGPWGRPDMAPILFAKAGQNDSTIKVFNHGRQQRDFTYIDDIIECIYRLIILNDFPKKDHVLNVGHGSPVNLLDFISTLENCFQKNFNKVFVEAQKGDVESTHADTTELKKLIHYTPTVDIAEGVGRFAQWFRDYYQI